MENLQKKPKRINSRSKGIRGERQVIEMLQPTVERCFTRAQKKAPILQRNTLQADSCASGNSDISGLDFLAIEVKNCAKLQISEWWAQCLRQCSEATKQQMPVLIYKTGGKFRIRLQTLLPGTDGAMRAYSDIEQDTFLQWFELVLTKHVAESCEYKPLQSIADPAVSGREAEAWCMRNGWPVPAYGTPEYMSMFEYWARLASKVA